MYVTRPILASSGVSRLHWLALTTACLSLDARVQIGDG